MDNKIEKMKDYSALASWAIWKSNRDDREFINEADLVENIDFIKYEHQLQKSNTIFVAMNPGGEFDEEKAKLSTRKREDKERPWNNFHNVGRSRDYLLAQAIKDTPESGSYMTDFFPIVGSKSAEIKKFINSKKNTELIEKLVLEFDEEISLLLPKEKTIKIICIGQNPFDWAKKFLKNDKFLLKKEYKIFCIPHYSGANNGGINSKANELGVENYYPTVVKTLLEKFRSEL
ncbi:hypothetical protein [Lactococcus lactis]|uniref:Uracil-DNA glycosylase-like domain-containing protein n=2 Tax=Lactococcus TaxID=1357 RepID=S6F6H9_LACLL|nr:hypothetical protein [Lactococcus lactis]CDG04409.1 Putative uncharacterized protein [Lactococcus lactis subsp. lactis A12]